jgi:hypothetical protein
MKVIASGDVCGALGFLINPVPSVFPIFTCSLGSIYETDHKKHNLCSYVVLLKSGSEMEKLEAVPYLNLLQFCTKWVLSDCLIQKAKSFS